MEEFQYLDIGMVLDFMDDYVKDVESDKSQSQKNSRRATQEDFDRF